MFLFGCRYPGYRFKSNVTGVLMYVCHGYINPWVHVFVLPSLLTVPSRVTVSQYVVVIVQQLVTAIAC